MSDTAIKVVDLSKKYNLGAINTGSFSEDLRKGWAKISGKKDPTLSIGVNPNLKEYWALKNINFEIKKGDSVGIIGKNGAGKSTLLKILSRVTTPTTGSINLNGRIASLLEVGTGFHPDLSGRENIFMNGAILGMSQNEIKTKLDEIIDFSGIQQYIDTPVKRYSSGMYVRLAFAVAAHLESDILIVDEVLAVGDAEFQKKCIGKMNTVSKNEGRTIIFVSHNLSSVLLLCKTAIYLNSGNLISHGKASDITDLYITESSKNYYSPDKNSDVYFDNILLHNQLKIAKTEFYVGETVILLFNLIINNRPPNIEISIDIHDKYEDLIAHISNYDDDSMSLESLPEDRNQFSFEVQLKNVNFSPGNYKVSLWSGSAYGNTFVYANNCISFNLHQDIGFIKRTNNYPSHAKTVISSTWSFA